jgi:hypothetical protein
MKKPETSIAWGDEGFRLRDGEKLGALAVISIRPDTRLGIRNETEICAGAGSNAMAAGNHRTEADCRNAGCSHDPDNRSHAPDKTSDDGASSSDHSGRRSQCWIPAPKPCTQRD